MARRLVVLGNTLTALAVCRDAHRRDFDPILVDRNWGIAFNTGTARPVLLSAGSTDSQACDEICRLSQPGPTYLIATGDVWVRFIMEHRQRLDAAFSKMLHADNDTLAICLNKARFARWCRQNAIPAPQAWFPGEEVRPEGMRMPLFLRPANTLHDRPNVGIPKAAEVRTEKELEELLGRYARSGVEPLVTESLLGEPLVQYSVAVARNGAETLSFVAMKVRPGPAACSVGTYVELHPNAEIEASVLSALAKLDYFGIAEVEVLHAPCTGRHVLIEINARPWLQYSLAAASGHDFLSVLMGQKSQEARKLSGLGWLNWHDDLYVAWSRSVGMVRGGKLGLREYLASLWRARAYAVFDRHDLAPLWRRLCGYPTRREKRIRMGMAK